MYYKYILEMEFQSKINITLNILPQQFNDDLNNFIDEQCKLQLNDNIYNGCLVKNIYNITFEKKSKINNNGSISINCNCLCNILNPNINDKLNIKINNINKMGYSYKIKKLCIFIPNLFITNNINENDDIEVEIIGKRIEKDIICIAKPI